MLRDCKTGVRHKIAFLKSSGLRSLCLSSDTGCVPYVRAFELFQVSRSLLQNQNLFYVLHNMSCLEGEFTVHSGRIGIFEYMKELLGPDLSP